MTSAHRRIGYFFYILYFLKDSFCLYFLIIDLDRFSDLDQKINEMKLKIASYSIDNNPGTDPQSIDLKEIMLSADAKALRGLAEFFRRAAE